MRGSTKSNLNPSIKKTQSLKLTFKGKIPKKRNVKNIFDNNDNLKIPDADEMDIDVRDINTKLEVYINTPEAKSRKRKQVLNKININKLYDVAHYKAKGELITQKSSINNQYYRLVELKDFANKLEIPDYKNKNKGSLLKAIINIMKEEGFILK